jgi:hypothetical protein
MYSKELQYVSKVHTCNIIHVHVMHIIMLNIVLQYSIPPH